MDAHKIGLFIKELRVEKGLTQMALANALSISDKTISKWECGLGTPDIALLKSISSFFNITVDELLLGEKAVKDTTTPLAKAVKSGIIALFDYDKQGRGNNLSFPDESGKTFLEYFVEFELYDYLRVFISWATRRMRKSLNNSSFSFFRHASDTYIQYQHLSGKQSKIQFDDDTIKFLNKQSGTMGLQSFYLTAFHTNIEKIFVGLIEKRQYELAEEILDRLRLRNKKYTEIALGLGCSFEVSRCFANNGEHQELENTELLKNGTYYEKERITFLETYDKNKIDSSINAKTLPTELQRKDILNVAITNEDDELICKMLDYEIELHDRNLVKFETEILTIRRFLIHRFIDYFGTHKKKELFRKYVSKETVDRLFYCRDKKSNYITNKFIHNRLSSNEIDCYRDYALDVLKNPKIHLEDSSVPGSSINNYIFDHEDSMMYEIIQKYHIRPKMSAGEELSKEYKRLVFEERYSYKKDKKINLDRIIAFVESNKEQHEGMAKLAKKFRSTETRYSSMTYKEYFVSEIKKDRTPSKAQSRNPIIYKLWKINDFDFFLRVVHNLDYDDIERDIREYQPEIGDLEKIRWVLENITRALSNSDLALLFLTNNH
jgi:transcriptional regulator with XRE-family HTH domain